MITDTEKIRELANKMYSVKPEDRREMLAYLIGWMENQGKGIFQPDFWAGVESYYRFNPPETEEAQP